MKQKIQDFINYLKVPCATRSLVMLGIFTGLVCWFVLKQHDVRKKKANYWKDGARVGKEMTDCELKELSALRNAATKFISNMSQQEKDHLIDLSAIVKSYIEAGDYVDYREISSDNGSGMKKFIKKWLEWRSGYRKSLSKIRMKCLRGAISKMSIQEKIDFLGKDSYMLI